MTLDKPRVLIAEIAARPDTADRVRDLLCEYGQTVRKEPGNIAFITYRVEGRPENFVVYEIYANEAAFQAHLAAPENAELNGRLGPLVEGTGSVLTFLEAVE